MKEFFKFFHSLLICLGLIWSLPGFSDVRSQKIAKDISVAAFVGQFEIDFHKAIASLNKNRENLQKLVESFSGEEKKFLLHFYRMNSISSLPEWKVKGEGYEFSYEGNRAFLSPRLAFQSKVWVNGKVFSFKGRDLATEQKRFYEFMNVPQKFSMLNFFVDDAEAAICGGICIAILFGAVIAGGLKVADQGFLTLEGDQASLNELLMTLKEKKGQCSIDLKEMRYRKDSTSPGEQDTFDDFKKLDQHVRGKIVVTDDEKKKLEPYILKEVLGLNIDSCEEFAELWSKKAGALAHREQRSSLEANQNAQRGKIAKHEEVCSVVESYATCISNYKYVENQSYDGQRRGGKNYRPETGLFRDRTFFEWAKDSIGK